MNIKYRWGIIAPGKIAHQFARALTVTDRGSLFAVGSRSTERAKEFAKQYGAEKAYGSYDQLINDKDVDIIYIATPHHLHYEISKKCLEADKPVLCEKPVTINAVQYKELMELSRKNKVFYMDALWTRFLPAITTALELVQKGTIGDIISLRADFGFLPPFDPEGRLFNKLLGGGCLLDIGIYPVFLSLLFLGYPDDIQARSVIGNTGVDESCNMIFSYRNGAMAILHSTIRANTDTSAEIAGSKGRIQIVRKWFKPSKLITILDNNPPEEHNFDYRMNGYEYEAEEVMRCLDKGLFESPLLPHDFTLQLMQLLDEVRKQSGIIYDVD